jgi:PAS domain S-box-containing protein
MPDAEPAAGSASERSDTTTGALLPGVARASRHFRRLARLEAALIVMVVAFSAAIAGTVLWLDRYVETHDRQIAEVNALASELVAMREDARNLQERALEREDRRLRRSDLLDGAGVLAAARRLESEATQALPAIAGRPETLAYRQALDGVSTAIAADLAAGGRTPALDSEVSRALDLVFARFERWLGMVLEAAGVRRDALRAQVSDVTRAVAGGVVALAILSIAMGAGLAFVRSRGMRAATGASHGALALLDSASDALLMVDGRGRVRFSSAQGGALLGRSRDDAIGMDLLAATHPDDREALARLLADHPPARRLSGESVRARLGAPGRWRHAEIRVRDASEDADVGGIVLSARDVTAETEARIAITAGPSGVLPSGLGGRAALERRITDIRADAGAAGALGILVVEGFEPVDPEDADDYVGDAALDAVVARLRESIAEDDVLARVEAGVFAVLRHVDAHAEDAACRALGALLASLVDSPVALPVGEVRVRARTGVAPVGGDVDSATELIRAAITAAQSGDREWERFEEGAGLQRSERADPAELARDLALALDRQDLRLVFQPIVDLGTRRTIGIEALLRWRHHELGDIPPARFIPLAEQTGLMPRLGSWVLAAAVEATREERTRSGGFVTINVSPSQFGGGGLTDAVAAVLDAEGSDGRGIVIEITESTVMRDSDALSSELRALRARYPGLRVALDDFGAGLSSLGELYRLPVDVAKIDRSLLAEVDRSSASHAFAAGMIAAVRALGLTTIAEGVERPGQWSALSELGVDLAQGYWLGRPSGDAPSLDGPAEPAEPPLAAAPARAG